jgi:hypothetical protein
MAKVELLTVGNLRTVLDHEVKLSINALNEVLSCCLEEQDLVVMISMVT